MLLTCRGADYPGNAIIIVYLKNEVFVQYVIIWRCTVSHDGRSHVAHMSEIRAYWVTPIFEEYRGRMPLFCWFQVVNSQAAALTWQRLFGQHWRSALTCPACWLQRKSTLRWRYGYYKFPTYRAGKAAVQFVKRIFGTRNHPYPKLKTSSSSIQFLRYCSSSAKISFDWCGRYVCGNQLSWIETAVTGSYKCKRHFA